MTMRYAAVMSFIRYKQTKKLASSLSVYCVCRHCVSLSVVCQSLVAMAVYSFGSGQLALAYLSLCVGFKRAIVRMPRGRAR